MFERVIGNDNDDMLFFVYPMMVFDPETQCWQTMNAGDNNMDSFFKKASDMQDVVEFTKKAIEAFGEDKDDVVTVVRTDFEYENPSSFVVVAGSETTPGASRVHWLD